MEFSYVKEGEEDHPIVLGKIEKMKITKKITCLDDEKRLTWYKIIPDETNDISGYVVRLTLENDYKFPRFLRSKYSELNQKNLMYNMVNNINKYIYVFIINKNMLKKNNSHLKYNKLKSK